jgi:dolichol-phosphate mannosyltransferase
VVELPFVFRERQHGVSKLDSKIVLDFAGLLIGKFTGEAISPRFFLFCLVGLTGMAIHLCTLAGLLSLANLRFEKAQALATVIAIGWNFVLNNYFTYRDQRLSGWRFVGGFVRFQLVCAIGAISNVGIAAWLYDYDRTWWIAGLAGALVGAVWNFALSSVFVWRQRSA